jgi:hypothetical protein
VPSVIQRHPPGRQLLGIALALPVLLMVAVLAFAWPAARLAPRDLPVGVVGAPAAAAQLSDSAPGAFDMRAYPDARAARVAIRDRDVYGAFVLTPSRITLLDASAASPVVAQLLTGVGGMLVRAQPGTRLAIIDIVALAPQDPRGAVFSSVLLPLTICGVAVAGAIAVMLGFRPVWRELVALTVVSATAALGVYAVGQGFLGVLPHDAIATWAALALSIFALAASIAGLVAALGVGGLGLGAALMVLIGNPFSGATSAPELLPRAVGDIGQWLPPGAAASLLRSTAYFDGHGGAGPVWVLTAWAVGGAAAIVAGHRPSTDTASVVGHGRHVARAQPAPAG